jgi:hypothetical protein
MQHIVFANNWWLCALSEVMARQGSTNYLAGKRIFAPWTGKTHTRVFRTNFLVVGDFSSQ